MSLHNRTDVPQTFLWWANVAARSHERYQSFFPDDVGYVADHARRAITAFPRADRPYYGVDYPALADEASPDADRLDFYSNIPVPTSYMVTDTRRRASSAATTTTPMPGSSTGRTARCPPGKKQWTWGNGAIGHAWDAQLTDDDGPYVELMAGVYTDNQPDFSYLAPGETQRFSQYWYPIHRIGPAQQAKPDAAVVRRPSDGTTARVGVLRNQRTPGSGADRQARAARTIQWWTTPLVAGRHRSRASSPCPTGAATSRSTCRRGAAARPAGGRRRRAGRRPGWPPAPEAPDGHRLNDELYLTAVHLTQYRHPTSSPLPYLEEALRRDPGDSRAATAARRTSSAAGRYDVRRSAARPPLDQAHPPQPQSARAARPLPSRPCPGAHGPTVDAADDSFAKAGMERGVGHAGIPRSARLALRAGRRRARSGTPRRPVTSRQAAPHRLPGAAGAGPSGRSSPPSCAHSRTPTRSIRRPLALDGAPATPRSAQRPRGRVLSSPAPGPGSTRSRRPASTPHPAPTGLRQPGAAPPLPARRLAGRAGPRLGSATRSAAARARPSAPTPFPRGWTSTTRFARPSRQTRRMTERTGCSACWLLDAGRTEDAFAHLRTATDLGSDDPVAWRNLALATVECGGDLDDADAAFQRALALRRDARLVFERDLLAQVRGLSSTERLALLEEQAALLEDRDDLALAARRAPAGRRADRRRVEDPHPPNFPAVRGRRGARDRGVRPSVVRDRPRDDGCRPRRRGPSARRGHGGSRQPGRRPPPGLPDGRAPRAARRRAARRRGRRGCPERLGVGASPEPPRGRRSTRGGGRLLDGRGALASRRSWTRPERSGTGSTCGPTS